MIKQTLQQKLQQKLSPQQIQLMKLIQLPTLAFDEKVSQEIEENPALENEDYSENIIADNSKDIGEVTKEGQENITEKDTTKEIDLDIYLSDDEVPRYKLFTNNYSPDQEDNQIPYSGGITFNEHLNSQVRTFKLSEKEKSLATYLVGCIDQSGYIRRDLVSISDDLAFNRGIDTTEQELEKVLKNVIHKLDPIGVGARDLKECLLLQLKNKSNNVDRKFAIELLENHYDDFIKKHYKILIKQLGITRDELKDILGEIEKLNPKPGNSFVQQTSKSLNHITPDFVIENKDEELILSLNSKNAPELKISRQYLEMLKTYRDSKKDNKQLKDTVVFIKQKLDSAKWFVDAVRQRQQTLYLTMNAIMDIQKEYFLSGDEKKLKPMILKDVAEMTDLDISTISRVASSKYVSTPYGNFLIKSFFSESITNDDGKEVSTKKIKHILQNAIDNEDKIKPLTDEKLSKLLKEKGFPIARRTIAKYREQLNIPVARLRKKL